MATAQKSTAGEGRGLNRTILLLNVGVLVVNFILAFSTTNSQIGLLQSTAAVSNGRLPRQVLAQTDASVTFLKVVQSVGSQGSQGTSVFNATNLRALHDAVRGYRHTIEQGVTELLARTGDGQAIRDAYDQLGRAAREDLELQLSPHFPDPGIVRRLTTEIIRNSG